MSKKTKAIVASVLVALVVLLTVLVWIQTKMLVITLGLLVVFAAALYFVMKKL